MTFDPDGPLVKSLAAQIEAGDATGNALIYARAWLDAHWPTDTPCPDGHVMVPITELEALREWHDAVEKRGNVGRWIPPINNLVDRIPRPKWEPSDEMVENLASTVEMIRHTSDSTQNCTVAIYKALHAAGLLRDECDGGECDD